jgi:hypothetical protein
MKNGRSMKKEKSKAERQGNTRKDYVGHSGIYPMSGPHPSGNAPLKGQMEWGQGERGAAGYEDSGRSELSLHSGTLLGGFDREWPGATAFERGPDGAAAREIAVAEWPAFCDWLSQSFHGIEISIERREPDGDVVALCRDCPFDRITARLLQHGVGAIRVVVEAKAGDRIFDVPGPKKIRLHTNPAGWPTHLEIACETEQVLVLFTGAAQSGPTYTGNSWGE